MTYYLALSPRSNVARLESGWTNFVLTKSAGFTGRRVHRGVSETDLLSLAATVAQEMQRIGTDVGRRLTSRGSSTLFLMATGGLVVYLLLTGRKQNSVRRPAAAVTPRRREGREESTAARLFDRLHSWLRWLVDGSEGAGGESGFFVEGEYFGPGSSTSPSGRGFQFSVSATTIRNDVPPFVRSHGQLKRLDSPLSVAPCPNCVKGACKLKKHRHFYAAAAAAEKDVNSSGSSMASSPKCNPPNSLSATTPYNADDEQSDLEPEENDLSSFINNVRMNSTFRCSASNHRRKSLCKTKQSPRCQRRRIPPEGKEGTASSVNLSCGEPACRDCFCVAQRNRCQREESVDSLAEVSGSMVDLVKGAREVRRLIRETSMDSIASDLSLGIVGNADRLRCELSSVKSNCDEPTDNFGFPPPPKARSSRSDHCLEGLRPTATHRPTGSSPDLLVQRVSQRNAWRISAPLGGFDSPLLKTATDESSMEWESPNHGWHDLRSSKYKVALSRSQSIVTTSDCDDILDGWEWDSEGLCCDGFLVRGGASASASAVVIKNFTGHESWLPDSNALDLDLENELGFSSSCSSRRNSSCGCQVSSQIRLPPSGCSSVAKGSSPVTSVTPSTSMDKEMMNLSLAVLHASHPVVDPSFPAHHPSSLRRTVSGCSLSGGKERNRRSSSSEESGVQDLEQSFDSVTTAFTCSQHNATSPLSPVHEAKEPRSSLTSPANEELFVSSSSTTRNNALHAERARRQLMLDDGDDDTQRCDDDALPDLETVTTK